MGSSCSKSRSVNIVEEQRPVRRASGKDVGQVAPAGIQGHRAQNKDNTVTSREVLKPRSKKNLIPDVEVFAELDERAVKAPEGHATIRDLVSYLIEPAKTPLEKARVLFRWVTSHIKYDVESYVTGSYKSQSKSYSPDAVLQHRTSICQGYSDIYKDMCRLAGVTCVTISGRAKGASYRVGHKFGPDSNHAWNAVEIDGRWYLLDSTWAAGDTYLEKKTFEFKFNEHYFFTDPQVFVLNHHPMDNKWQLLQEPVPIEVFENQAFFRPDFFKLGLKPSCLSHTMSPVCTQNGEATICIKAPEPMSFLYNILPYDGGSYQNEYVLHEIVDSTAIFRVAPAEKGKFLLQIFGKLRTAKGVNCSHLCSYVVESDVLSTDHVPFPRLGRVTWGPGPWLLDGFMTDVSHPNAIVTLPEGEAKITFNSVRPLQYMCDVKEGDKKWDNYAFPQVGDLTASIYIRAPKTGQFTLTIWAKEWNEAKYSNCVYYVLKCNKCKTGVSPFPQKFSNWINGCQLYEPLDGCIAANRRVHFRVACPNATEVVVIASKWHHLTKNTDGSWEGDANAGNPDKGIIKVSTKNPGDTQYWTLLQYKVVA